MWLSDKEESCGYQWKQKQIPVDGEKSLIGCSKSENKEVVSDTISL